MSPQDLIRLLRRYWPLAVALVLLGVASGVGASLLITPLYVSTARVYVAVASDSQSVLDLSQGGTFAEKAVQSYAEVATSPRVLEPVIASLGLHETSQQLAKRVDVSTSANSVVMGISATDPSPAQAAAIANSVSSEIRKVVPALNPSAKGSATISISPIESATPAASPASPNLGVNALVGGILGLVVALLLIGVRRLLVNKVETVDDLQSLTEAPLVGEIVRDRAVGQHPLRILVDPLSNYAESIRDLRTNLQYLTTAEGAQTIVLTSAGPAEGKTTTSVNLALALAGAQGAILVDADLRKPRVADLLGLEGKVGLTDVLVGRVTLDEAVQTVADSGLAVLPAGGHPPNASELLQSDAMRRVVAELSERYSTVLFDSPPAGLLSDARVLARQCSGALVIAGLQRTKRPQLRTALQALDRAGARTLGIVATFVPGTSTAYYELERAEGLVPGKRAPKKRAPRVRAAGARTSRAS